MSKRPGSPLSGPPAKKSAPAIANINFGPVTGQEELNLKTLQVQNKMLSEKNRQKIAQDHLLRKRLESQEAAREELEKKVAVVMGHWSRLDEQVQAMLYQCGAVRTLGKQPDCASLPVRALLKKVQQAADESLASDALLERCKFTVSSIRDLTRTLEHLYQRVSEECTDVDLGKENERLEELVTALRGQVCESGAAHDKIINLEERVKMLKAELESTQYDLGKAVEKTEKVKIRLEDANQLLSNAEQQAVLSAGQAGSAQPHTDQTLPPAAASQSGNSVGTAEPADSSVYEDLKLAQDLSGSRLKEIEQLQQRLQEAVLDLELARSAVHQVSDTAIQHSPLFLSLQSQYSTLFQERQQLKTQVEEALEQLKECKDQYVAHLDKIETDEMKYHRAAQEDISRLSDRLADSQRQLQAVRMENEQNRVASDQASTLKELRRFAGGLQKENKQLKAELTRCKQTVDEANRRLERLQDGVPLATLEIRAIEKRVTDKPKEVQSGEAKDNGTLKEELKKMKEELKKAQESEKESKMLLDAYKGVSKDLREKADVMASEAKQKIKLEELQQTLDAQRERLARDCLNDSEASQRWKEAQDTIEELHKSLASSERNHTALLSEMELTGDAFEDMQEQNARLLSQLQEKDDANFKLMSDRYNANTLHSLLREEKQAIDAHAQMLQQQIGTQSELIQHLHEKETLLQMDLSGHDDEVVRRQAQADSLKRKALECAQSAQDRKIQSEKSATEVRELRQKLAEQHVKVEQDQHQMRRLKEEITSLQKKLDRSKQPLPSANADEILQEEVKIYKKKAYLSVLRSKQERLHPHQMLPRVLLRLRT
eukprot:scpid45637/ scgid16910/ E3 ubiquitin-protein ligase BRE1B; RING finger protein 40; Syntaxin-1-interacting RING finger protein